MVKKLIKGSLSEQISNFNKEYKVGLYVNEVINKNGGEVRLYASGLESGRFDEPYATKSGETYKFIEPMLEESLEELENKLALMLISGKTSDKMAEETMKIFKDRVKEEIFNKKTIKDRKRKNRTLIETKKLVESIKVTKEIIR